jgi:hypothetical protein
LGGLHAAEFKPAAPFPLVFHCRHGRRQSGRAWLRSAHQTESQEGKSPVLPVKRLAAVAPLVLLVSACMSYAIDAPQTRDEFVARVKKGGFMKDAESLTVSRPFKTVAADLRQFADQCLNVTHRIRANHMTKDNGGVTYYQAKVDTSKAGFVTLSLQGEQPRMHGQPPGGLYRLVAEVSGKGGSTGIHLYYIGTHDFVADGLKLWANGNKGKCPEFS